jgi:hypothetical protein
MVVAFTTTDMPQTEGYENHIFTECKVGDVNQFDYTAESNLIRLRPGPTALVKWSRHTQGGEATLPEAKRKSRVPAPSLFIDNGEGQKQ